MSLTNANDFLNLIKAIPKAKMDKVWFFPIRQNKKNPDVPSGTVLKGNLSYRLSYHDCLKRLKWGKNVGIYALTGGLMFLDLDVKNGALIASSAFLQQVNPTFTIRSRNGGYQFYYWNNGEYPNQVLRENGKDIGELRTDWFYVVAVGSYVTPDENNFNGDGTYRIILNLPISEFQPFGEYFKKNDTVENKEIITFSKPDSDDANVSVFNEQLKAKGKSRRLLSYQELRYLQIRGKRSTNEL